MKRYLIVVVLIVISSVLMAGCSGSDKEDSLPFYPSLGDYDYESSLTAFVYEPVADEEEYGIQYREVTDMEKLLSSDFPVLIYFHSSLSPDTNGITAGAEDIAQCTWGNCLVIMADVLEENDLANRFGVEKVPEFVLVRSGNEISSFQGYNYEVWTMSDVASWVSGQGIRVDYSKIDQE